MIYLIHYNRKAGHLSSIREYPERERANASQAKLELEISLLCENGDHEVVLLEAASQDELRKTHRRYFDSLEDMKTKRSDSNSI